MKGYHLAYVGLASLVGFAEVTTATPATSGMLAKTVCVSPFAFLMVAALPLETLVTAAQKRLGVMNGNGSETQ